MTGRQRVTSVVVAFLWAVLLLLRPLQGTRLWFDEGWSLVVAKTWALTGVYARPLMGTPISAVGMAQPFSSTFPIGLSFRLLGVGIWQGRLPGLLVTIGALILVYRLTVQIYSVPIALGTLAVLLFCMPHAEIHPALVGRQALAEMPMVFYLLAGYVCLSASWRRPLLFAPASAAYWGIALTTKAHVLPFWLVSVLVPCGVAVAAKKPRMVAIVGGVAVASLVAACLMGHGTARLEEGLPLYGAPMEGLYTVTAFVLDPRIRAAAIVTAFALSQPAISGIAYAASRLRRERCWNSSSCDWATIVRLSMLCLALVWLAWYAMLSVGWVRYLFPPVFLASPHVSALLYRYSSRFHVRETVRRLAAVIAGRRIDGDAIRAAVAVWILVVAAPPTAAMLLATYTVSPNRDVVEVTGYLNAIAADGEVIETYDSELLFLLDGPCHYPPDQVQVELNRRTFLRRSSLVNYDPLVGRPTYLVVGPFGRMWDLYGPVVRAGAFDLIATFGPYQVFRRVWN